VLERPSATIASTRTAGAPVSLEAWHGAWLAALILGAGVLLIAPVRATSWALAALLSMMAPAAVGLWLSRARSAVVEGPILFGWAAGGLTATLLTGGLASPLAVWCLAPLAAAAAMARPQRLALGAALSLGALGIASLSSLVPDLPPAPAAPLGQALGTIGLPTLALALGIALVVLQRGVDLDRRRTAQSDTQVREALADQPDLLLAIYPSGRLAAVWGRSPEALKGQVLPNRVLAQIAAAADRPRIEAALRQAVHQGAAKVAFAAAGETEPSLELSLRRASPTRVMGMVRDIRDQVAREAALEAARAEAEAQNAGKSRFLANMSHELRTPLNAIMGFSDIMRQRLFGPMSDRYADYSELIHESGGHLLELINDVLDMSKIEAERFELNLEPFDARDAINAVLRLMRGQADRAGVHLRGLVPREPLNVMADRRALKQIALNLISNALKFTPKDGSVTVTVQAAGPALELIVADTGEGIGAEDLLRLGRPFEQAGDGTQRANGTGLGLSLVRAFSELHGGEMQIESQLGEGTTVIVRLPVMDLDAGAVAAAEAPAG
jgi:cell cycle sensor histidine kinase DivJ